MCSDNINNFISLPHSPPKGVPVLWQDSLLRNVSHFLVSNVPSKFYLLVFFFSSSFPISNSKTWPFFFFSVCYHTTHHNALFCLEKKAQNGKIEKTQPTHTHTTAAAERALQFNMFCETLAGVGKMEMERHKGSGEMSIEN